jgi:glycosyltransferase involved in cell wall biosynthesis
VRDYLARHAARLLAISHPLNREDPPVHRVVEWRKGQLVNTREITLPSRPPATYLLDAFAPFRRGKHDVCLAFSNLSAIHAIARRRSGRFGKVVYWAVDFVPDRFGRGSWLTKAYDTADRIAATRSDLRVELTSAARDARSARLKLSALAAGTHVAPVGGWLDRLERTTPDAWQKRRAVFLGHLVPRQGVEMLVRAIALVPDLELQIAGRGPEEVGLRSLADELGIGDRVQFIGFLDNHRDVERFVASGSVAVAPYATDMESFTRYADPSKLRSYTSAGLPVVLTNVPPNALELEREAGAVVVDYTPEDLARGMRQVLETPEGWSTRRQAALDYSMNFDWAKIVPTALERIGYKASS